MEPVAGLGQMGAHHTAIDVGRDSFLIDCGVLFPAPWDVGVEHIAPPLEPALQRAREGRLRSLLLTHGHRDHIGAVGHLADRVPGLSVHATPFTAALLRRVLGERSAKLDLHIVHPGRPVQFGETTATWFGVTHSLPEACSLALETRGGTLVHSGDFRVQPDPFLGPRTDEDGLRGLGDRGVDLALVDSTGAARPGRTLSERTVADNLAAAVDAVDGLVLITVFSTHIERVAACVEAARRCGRVPALYGRSLESTVALARDQGIFGDHGGALRDVEHVAKLGGRGLVVVTGTQGEWRAPLARIARGEDPRIRVRPGDAVLWSARAIPGNDRAIGLVVNRLVDLGVSVTPPWGSAGRGLHTSGHGLRDEVGEWLSWVRPRAVLPIHGEAWHLAEHRRALLEGRPDTEVLDLRSGGAVEFGPGQAARTVGAPTDRTFPVGVGRELWSGTERALRDRRRIARTGVVTASVEGDRVEVVAVGVFPEAECRQAEMELRAAAQAALKQDPRPGSIEDLESRVRLTLRRAVKARTGERVECIVRGRFSRHGN